MTVFEKQKGKELNISKQTSGSIDNQDPCFARKLNTTLAIIKL